MESIDAQSIEQRLRARIEEKQAHHTIDLPVHGFEDLFKARYRALTYREMKRIGRQAVTIEDDDERELCIAADILAVACEEVFEVGTDGEDRSLGGPWNAGLGERLGLSHVESGRQCLLAIFTDELDLIAHRDAYIEWRDDVTVKAANSAAGNSGA